MAASSSTDDESTPAGEAAWRDDLEDEGAWPSSADELSLGGAPASELPSLALSVMNSGGPEGAEVKPPERRRVGPGDIIANRYQVEGQLGRGGMGRVLRVRHVALGKSFALKLIKSPIAGDPRMRDMFYREARLASSLTHESICSIVDFGDDATAGLFMVMELLDGQTLHQRLRHGGPMTPKAACDVMWQTCSAVRFMHARGIVHGDLKSENLFLVRGAQQQRVVRLLDFGLARSVDTPSDRVDGTPEYLAPERVRQRPLRTGAPATVASDIYALGILFFELLTGKLPFTGEVDQVLAQQLHAALPPASAHGADGLESRAEEILAKATAKEPAQRHVDVAALMYEIRTLMGMLGGTVSRARTPPMDGPKRQATTVHDGASRVKAESEIFCSAPMPMAVCTVKGQVRVANSAFWDFVGGVPPHPNVQLEALGLTKVWPSLHEDLATVAAERRTLKRVIYLAGGGTRVVETALILAAAPRTAAVTMGDLHLYLHPLRVLA